MLFEWTEEKIEWYVRASRASGFHRALAGRILPFLKRADHVVDLGCGAGLIDLELAPHVEKITGIDINPLVLGRFDREIEQ